MLYFGEPPRISTIANDVKHNRKIVVDKPGIADEIAGHSINLNLCQADRPSSVLNLCCSSGIDSNRVRSVRAANEALK